MSSFDWKFVFIIENVLCIVKVFLVVLSVKE